MLRVEGGGLGEGSIDLLVVGGGINGAGIARDAAGRGLSVVLVEKDDLAAYTSSSSSKLVHGGLRYLEQLEFRLVRDSLAERERLMRVAPHIVEPLQFVIPSTSSSRPAWMVRAGLFLYDHLGKRELLPASRSVRLDGPFGEGLKPGASKAFAYWDCRVQDSRLVVLNAIDAAERGAAILTRTELVNAHREAGQWLVRLRGPAGEQTIRSRALVNAAGPWAAQLFDRLAGARRRRNIRLVKGSHIVLPRLYAGGHACILQNPDRRVVFTIPFEGQFTLVGTTDVDWNGAPAQPVISEAETDYLLETVDRYFDAPISSRKIVWAYSGIRTLAEDGGSNPSRVTRDYFIELDTAGGKAPLLSVFGGKLTTYRHLSERVLKQLAPFFPNSGVAWTGRAILPGGEIPDLNLDGYASALACEHPELPKELVARLARTYGTRSERLLEGVGSLADLGEVFGAGLTSREVDYLVSQEWARTAEDILFRRTKLGLSAPPGMAERLAAYLET
jgi:glycerol-3-phosphate dehydrogenase